MNTQPHHLISPDPEATFSVESLSEAILVLAAERQSLRARAATAEDLEQNRLELVNLHQQLARALIERHLPPGTERPAAA